MLSIPTPIISALRNARSAILTAHTSPDGDAIGSVFAFAKGLEKLGTSTCVYLADGVPERYSNLTANSPYVTELPGRNFDLSIAVDTATQGRIGVHSEAFLKLGATTLNIDHHVSNEKYADHNYIETTASSAQLVMRILKALDVEFDRLISNLLFAGLLDDTGSFRHANSDLQAFEDAAQLVRDGAEPYFVSQELFARVPVRVLKLRAAALSHMRVYAAGRIGVARVSRALLGELGATEADTGGLIDEVRSLDGVSIAATIRETDRGWKVSLRSDAPRLDVNEVASRFGGGGHTLAAGCVLQGLGEDVEARVVSELEKLFED